MSCNGSLEHKVVRLVLLSSSHETELQTSIVSFFQSLFHHASIRKGDILSGLHFSILYNSTNNAKREIKLQYRYKTEE
jgi:hypothetical protein